MTRFFVYLAEALQGLGPTKTLDDLWQFVQMSNAINDVVSGNRGITEWAHAGSRETSVIHQFMMERSPGRLRNGHVYADTEVVLGEIAADHGILPQYESWLKNPGYIPESLFYVMIGWPERILFFEKEWAEIEAEYLGTEKPL